MPNIQRRKSGSKALDVSEFLAMVRQGLPGTQLAYGLVTKFQGESQHYEIDNDNGQVLVQVSKMPDETPLLCVLATSGAGSNAGVWKIPKPGTEVIVGIPEGELEADPVIIACTASGTVPSELDGDNMVIRNPDGSIKILSPGDTVQINGDSYSLLKTDDFMADLKLFISAVITDLASAAAAPASTYTATLNTTALFAGVVTNHGNPYKSSKAKNG